jgi:hypothetical protein
MPPSTEHTTLAAPEPKKPLSIAIESIAFDGQIYSAEEILSNPQCEGRKKFLYEGKPRRVIAVESVGVNSKCEGDFLAAQIVFAHNLQQAGITAATVVLGCCTLQYHTRKIRKFGDLAKNLAQQIKDSWDTVDTEKMSKKKVGEINALIKKLTKKHSQEKNKTLRETFFELITDLHKNFECVIPDFKKSNLGTLTDPEKFASHISIEALKQSLRSGNDWRDKANKIFRSLPHEIDIPVIRWPNIFNITDQELISCQEYQEFSLEKIINNDNSVIKTLITDMQFPSAEIKLAYMTKIKKYYTDNTDNCQKAFDNTVTEYLSANDPNQNWQNIIGYSNEESRQACHDYLFEECAWFAYIAEKHPDILILYPDSKISPAVEWTFRKFHLKQEICWLPVTTMETKLEENNSMKPVAKTSGNKNTAPAPTTEQTIRIEFNAEGYTITLPKGDPKEVEETLKAVRNGLGFPSPEYPKQPRYLPCVLL